MSAPQTGIIPEIFLALVVGLSSATGSSAATVGAHETPISGWPTVWQQNLSGGMGLASLAMSLPHRQTQPQIIAPLPGKVAQLTFSLAPTGGAIFSFARNGKVVTSTLPTPWHKSYIRQAVEVTSFHLAGRPWSLQLLMGKSGGLHLSLNFRDSAAARIPFKAVTAVLPLETAAATPAAVPLPATFWQGLVGLSLLVFRRRLRRVP